MNKRELFRASITSNSADWPCHLEWGFWEETYDRWLNEGLPQEINFPEFPFARGENDLFDYFGITKIGYIRIDQYFEPPFETEIVEETEAYVLQRTERGVLERRSKISATPPHCIEFSVNNKKDYRKVRERLTARIKERYPPDWPEWSSNLRTQEQFVTGIHLDGFFAYPRELMGFNNFLVSLYEEPELIRMMIGDRVEFYIKLYEKAIRDTRPDFAFIWEDMCYKNGPMLSPEMFGEFLQPAYRRLTRFLTSCGIRIILVDSDGDVRKLLPHWLECGVTGVLPFEVQSGMDVVSIAEAFPNLSIIGGIDKRRIAEGKKATNNELKRVLPSMSKRGKYCASLDHWVPPDISFKDFEYYARAIRNWSSATK